MDLAQPAILRPRGAGVLGDGLCLRRAQRTSRACAGGRSNNQRVSRFMISRENIHGGPLLSTRPETRRNVHSARAPSLLAFSLLALLVACRPAAEPPAPEIRPVRVMTVTKTVGGETVTLTGNIQAQTEVNLSFRIDGRMIQRNVNVGDVVKPGQLVATLNADNEENALQSARASLAAARAQLVEARNNYDRYKTLLAQRFVAEAEFDRFAAILKTAQAQVDSAQAQVNIAQNRLGYAQLIADAGGTVTAVGAEPGEVVQGGRMIVQIARQGGRDAVFDVSPQIKDSAPANPEITVSLPTDPKVTATGRVREVSPRADPATGTFRVRVGLTNPPATECALERP